MWLFTLLLAATDHSAADAIAKRIDAAGNAGVIHTVSAGQGYSLEGSTGEAIADQEGHVRKITMTFLGETYRQDMVIYVDGGKAVMARVTTGRYRGGLQDPKVIGKTTANLYFDGTDTDAELSATATKLGQTISECIAKAKPCEEVDAISDPQPTDTSPRIAFIKGEFARTERERGSYAKTDFDVINWGLKGKAFKTKTGELRLVTLDIAGAPATHVDFYFVGQDLLFGLMRGTTTTRVYYDHDGAIRIVDGNGKRVRVSSDSMATYVQPFADYLGVAREKAR